MYKKELTQCTHFSMAHALTAYTGELVEDISNSYPTFIKVLQPVTVYGWLFPKIVLLLCNTSRVIFLH